MNVGARYFTSVLNSAGLFLVIDIHLFIFELILIDIN